MKELYVKPMVQKIVFDTDVIGTSSIAPDPDPEPTAEPNKQKNCGAPATKNKKC